MKAERLLLSLIAMFASLNVDAEDFQVDGIAYNILSISDRTVEMTCPAETWSRETNHNVAYPYKHVFNIPEQVTYQGITWKVIKIGPSAFAQTRIDKLSIPMTVKCIDGTAFWYASGNIQLDLENSGVEEIDGNFFEAHCFTGTMKIPSRIHTPTKTLIFEKCENLSNIIFPDNYSDYHILGATQCYNLKHITLPFHINRLYGQVAAFCDKIDEIILNDVDTFFLGGGGIAYLCSGLNRVYLGKTFICLSEEAKQWGGDYAPLFLDCPNLKDIIVDCEDPLDFYYDDAFSKGQYVYTTLWVPEGCAEKYRSKAGWKNFFNIKEGRPDDAKCIVHTEDSEDGSIEKTNSTNLASENVDYVNVNGSASFVITPYEGKEIESVTVNGADVTDRLTTLPVDVKAKRIKKVLAKTQYMLEVNNIKRNIDVKVKYKNNETAVLCVDDSSEPIVTSKDGCIVVKGCSMGSLIEIYDMSGRLVSLTKVENTKNIIPMKQGSVYLVKVNGYSKKIRI